MNLSSIKNEYHVLKRLLFVLLNKNDIPPGVVPKSTLIGHWCVGTVVHPKAKIGENCFIGQNVTIGAISSSSKHAGVPTIEDSVYIHANSCIVGGVTIGHGSTIAAGAVVYKDVPPYSLVTGDCEIHPGKYSP